MSVNCLGCAKEITNKARLRDKNDNVRFKCGNCDKDYARKDSLLKHSKICGRKE
jgi:transcription elongation factor Elf1